MLGIFAVLGLLMTGLLGSALIGQGDDQEDGDDTAPADPAEVEAEAPAPVGTDILDTPPAPTELTSGGDAAGQGIRGTEGNDALEAGDAPSLLEGLGGDDQLFGGAGSDTIDAGDGRDTVEGGFGDDVIFGGDGDDSLMGQMGDDWLEGGAGDDTLFGGSGDDTLIGGAGQNWLAGGLGDDLMVAGADQNTLDADQGNNTLVGNVLGLPEAVGNFLNGGTGDDMLVLGAGDIATGGLGADTFVIAPGPDAAGTIADFDPAVDRLIVLFDPSGGDAPELTIAQDTDAGGTLLRLDGEIIARLEGTDASALTPGMIELRAETAAAIAGLPPPSGG